MLGIPSVSQLSQAIHCIGYYLFHGDQSNCMPAYGALHNEIRKELIMQIIDDSDLAISRTFRAVLQQQVNDACEWRPGTKKMRQQAGNTKRHRQAYQRIIKVYEAHFEKTGQRFTPYQLSRKAKCDPRTAQKALNEYINMQGMPTTLNASQDAPIQHLEASLEAHTCNSGNNHLDHYLNPEEEETIMSFSNASKLSRVGPAADVDRGSIQRKQFTPLPKEELRKLDWTLQAHQQILKLQWEGLFKRELKDGADYLQVMREVWSRVVWSRKLLSSQKVAHIASATSFIPTKACKYCGEKIAFLMSSTGKAVPVEPECVTDVNETYSPSKHQRHYPFCSRP